MPSDTRALVAALAARTASLLGRRSMRVIARANRVLTNPAVGRYASRAPYLAVIVHTGRRSGRTYRTPVMVFVDNDRLSVALNYGLESDWVRNVLAAGTAEVLHRGRRYRLAEPLVVATTDSGLDHRGRSRGGACSALEATFTPIEPRQA
jgi:deazaflavin-dependent oxidoreductase (nitroreductase family)